MTSQYLPRINIPRIRKFAELAKQLPIPTPLNFFSYSPSPEVEIVEKDSYPPLHAPGAIDFFFFSALHNYGFWSDKDGKYDAPVYGKIAGKRVKGSDLLYRMLLNEWKSRSDAFLPERLASISEDDFGQFFVDEGHLFGYHPLFFTKERLKLTKRYGKWFRPYREWTSPEALVIYANTQADPVGFLRYVLTHAENGVWGFHEDPLGKKAELLIMSLVNRPEKFLRTTPTSTWKPIVDYHDMRITLRMGHITLPKGWVDENESRSLTSYEREAAIRLATYKADELAIRESGLTRDQMDVLKWSARKFCPEMEVPKCTECVLRPACAQYVRRFQPVIRTTFY